MGTIGSASSHTHTSTPCTRPAMTALTSTLAVAAGPKIPADAPRPDDDEASLPKRIPKTPLSNSTEQLQDMVLDNNTSARSTKGQRERESPGKTPKSGTPKDKDMSEPHEQQQKKATKSPAVPAPAAVMTQSSPENEINKSQAKDESKSALKTMDSPVVVVEEEAAGKEEEKEISTFKLATAQREQHDVVTKKERTNRREVMDKNALLPLTGDEWRSQPAQQPPIQAQQRKQEQKQLKKQESAAPEQAFPVVMERGITKQAQQQQQQQRKQKQEGNKMTVPMNAPSAAVVVRQPWEATKQQRQKRKNQKKQEFATPEEAPSLATEGGPSKQAQPQQPNARVQQLQQQQQHQGLQQRDKGVIESRQALLPTGEWRPPLQQQQPQQQENEFISVLCTGSPAGQQQRQPSDSKGQQRLKNQQRQQQQDQQQQRQGKEQQKELPFAPAPLTPSLPRNFIPGPAIALAHPPSTSSIEHIRRHLAALARSGTVVMESLPVPLALAEWTGTHAHELKHILTQTMEKSNALSIILEEMVKGEGGQEGGKKVSGSKSGQVLLITAMSTEEAYTAKTLLELHLKNQQQLLRTERRLQQVQNDIMVVEKEVAAGLRIEFGIRKELGGIVVGKKGERVNRVLAETGVSSINVGDDGMIRVVGPTVAAVMKAREMLELVQEGIQVPLEAVAWLSRPMLEGLKQKSGCVVLRTENVALLVQQQRQHSSQQQYCSQHHHHQQQQQQQQQEQQASVSRNVTVVRMVGTHKQVENARLLINTQIEYGGRHQAMRSSEEQMLGVLNHAEASYSYNSGSRRFLLKQQELRSQQQPWPPIDGFPHVGGSTGGSSARRGGGGDKRVKNQGVRPQQQQQQQLQALSAFEAASVQDSRSDDKHPKTSRNIGRGNAARSGRKNGGASGDDVATTAMAPPPPARSRDRSNTDKRTL